MSDEKKQDGPVLVTGASGYIAGFIINLLLKEGYQVRGTVRDASKEYPHLKALEDKYNAKIQFVSANLTDDAGWEDAVRGCPLVMHTASPFVVENPKHESELITPAVDGTRRVLEACAKVGGVRRVVLTSSIASIQAGNTGLGRKLTEEDWSDVDKAEPYPKSKTLAERKAWEIHASLPEDSRFELAVVNPSYVQGPVMTKKGAASHEVVSRLLNRVDPGLADLPMSVVDVRDVAEVHYRAMIVPEAAGKRFICDGGFIGYVGMGKVLAAEFNPLGYNVPTKTVPFAVLWMLGRCDKKLRAQLPSIGKKVEFDNSRAQEILGVKFRPVEQTMIDMGYSVISHGIVPNKLKPAVVIPPDDY